MNGETDTITMPETDTTTGGPVLTSLSADSGPDPDGNPPSEAAPAPKPKKIKATPALDGERLKRLVAEIEDRKQTQLIDLLHRLEAEEGAVFKDTGTVTVVKLAGVRAESTAGVYFALMNWANAARRAVFW